MKAPRPQLPPMKDSPAKKRALHLQVIAALGGLAKRPKTEPKAARQK